MTKKLIIEEQSGKIRVALRRSDDLIAEPYGEFEDFTFPIEPDALEDLRWYLEDYLPAPHAVWEERGGQIQARLPEWGAGLFASLFGQGRPFRDAYIEAKADDDFQIRVSSNSAAFLGLPWELMYDPEAKNFIALGSGGIHRTLPAAARSAVSRTGEELRVLMVIARPEGEGDVPCQMIARQLLQRIDLVSGKVVLDVLRPPTLQALKQKIARAAASRQPYDVLHFDGHASFTSAATKDKPSSSDGNQVLKGHLVFENENGEADPVSADDLAPEMARADIPLLVFNACKSGPSTAAGGPEAAVVTRLIQQGAAAAVAMGYSVHAVAAAEFMAMFYEALFAGRSVAEAVQQGRRQMQLKNGRPSPKGEMPLEDWLVPVHYARREILFPQLKTAAQADPQTLADTLKKLKETRSDAAESNGTTELMRAEGRFLGRDAELSELERVFGSNGVVIAHGAGGSGKSELAKAFARWLQASGGLSDPRLVFMDVFESGLASFGLSHVLSSFGLGIMGPDFLNKYPTLQDQQEVVLQVLAENRILWIWDNFETVCAMPDQSSGCRLDQAGQSQMKDFLLKARERAAVGILITSRDAEQWLGPDLVRMAIGGLTAQDAALYADDLLATRSDAQKRRDNRAFGDLMAFLGGHPLSMRFILPHLERVDAQSLVDGLKGQGELPAGFEGEQGRLASLGAAVYYALRHMPEEDRQRLPVLSLFEEAIDVNLLDFLSSQDNVPDPLRGVSKNDWNDILSRCCDTGLLTEIGNGIYAMHAALPGYLTAWWKEKAGTRFEDQREQALVAGIQAHAALGRWLYDQIGAGPADTAMSVLSVERATFLQMLQEALRRALYVQAQAILKPINEFWNARGLYAEARAWTDRLLDLLESKAGAAPDVETDAGALWLFAAGSKANRSHLAGDLAVAEKMYDHIRIALEKSQSEAAKTNLATIYHQLGIVAQKHADLDAAETRYKKSLEITEALGNRADLAATYHQLGMVAEDRGDLDAAEDWTQKSLEIKVAFDDRPGLTTSYGQLGRLAQKRGDLDAAENWNKKSVEVNEAFGNRPGLAYAYGNLGALAEKRGHKTKALEWAVRCVSLFDEVPHPATGPGPAHLVRLSKELGIPVLEDKWQMITGAPLPDRVRRFVEENS
jgi:tetratricopeptide (TPR) repeat protein